MRCRGAQAGLGAGVQSPACLGIHAAMALDPVRSWASPHAAWGLPKALWVLVSGS